MAKLDAMKAYDKARRFTSADTILAGLMRYLEHLPDELRFIPHAATWLRAGRYDDDYDAPVTLPGQVDWYQECAELHNHECGLDRWRHAQRKKIEGAA